MLANYLIALHPVFEWSLFAIIVVNGFCSLLELTVSHTTVLSVLAVFNYIFCICYIIEAIIKVSIISFTNNDLFLLDDWSETTLLVEQMELV